MFQGQDANLMWKNSHPYPSNGDHWYQKGWVIYLVVILAVFIWIFLRAESERQPRTLSASDSILHEDQSP